VAADGKAVGKLVQSSFVYSAFDLHPVGSWMAEARVGYFVLQNTIVSKQQQALTIGI
jgi:hypothetical protein